MRWLAFPLRLGSIGLVTFVALLWYAGGRLRTFFIGADRRRAAVARLRGRVLRWSMTVLGATFIKLGQVMSSRPDLFEPELIDELQHLQDRLPAFSPERARRQIEADLKRPLGELYNTFDPKPVAAASVAQVHHARLRDGTEVAVKVLRPDVRRKAQRDAAILLFGARILGVHPHVRAADLFGHLEHFVEGIIEQTDLAAEARNLLTFRENFAATEGILFPRPFLELCGPRVMTVEFVRGVKIDALDPGDHAVIGRRLQDMFLKMCFVDGFLHVDLHPGNLLVTNEGIVAVFDCGLVKRLDGELLDEFIDFNRCLAFGSVDDLVQHLRRFHTYLDDVDWSGLSRDVTEFHQYFRGKKQSELEMGELINRVFALGRKYNVRPRTEMALMMVGAVTAEGIGKMINPHVNSMEEMGRYLMPIVQQRLLARAASG